MDQNAFVETDLVGTELIESDLGGSIFPVNKSGRFFFSSLASKFSVRLDHLLAVTLGLDLDLCLALLDLDLDLDLDFRCNLLLDLDLDLSVSFLHDLDLDLDLVLLRDLDLDLGLF